MNDEKAQLERERDEWKTHYEAMARSCEGLVELNKQLHDAMAIMEAEKRQWVAKEAMMNSVIQQTIDRVNAQSNAYLEENKQLRAEIMKLRGG